MMLGLPFSFYYQSDDVFAIIISSVLTSSIGLLTWFFTKNSERKDVGKREGYLIVTFGWILMSAFGAIPFVVHGSIPSYTDALDWWNGNYSFINCYPAFTWYWWHAALPGRSCWTYEGQTSSAC